jgi:hypothetical protein
MLEDRRMLGATKTVEFPGSYVTAWDTNADSYSVSDSSWSAEGGLVIGKDYYSSTVTYTASVPDDQQFNSDVLQLTGITVKVYGKGFNNLVQHGSADVYLGSTLRGTLPEEAGWNTYEVTAEQAKQLLVAKPGIPGLAVDVTLKALAGDVVGRNDWYDIQNVTFDFAFDYTPVTYLGNPIDWLSAFYENACTSRVLTRFANDVIDRSWRSNLNQRNLLDGVRLAAAGVRSNPIPIAMLGIPEPIAESLKILVAVNEVPGKLEELQKYADLVNMSMDYDEFLVAYNGDTDVPSFESLAEKCRASAESTTTLANIWVNSAKDGAIQLNEVADLNSAIDATTTSLDQLAHGLMKSEFRMDIGRHCGGERTGKGMILSLAPLLKYSVPDLLDWSTCDEPNSVLPCIIKTLTARRLAEVSPLTVTAPQDGQSWEVGWGIDITWAGGVPGDEVRVELFFLDSGATIGLGTTTQGTIQWASPGYPYLGMCQAKVTSIKAPELYGWSGTFEIFDIPIDPNQPPRISLLADTLINQGTYGQIPFIVDDDHTPPDMLGIAAIAANAILLPPDSIFVLGSGSNRVLAVRPADGQAGNTIITVTVMDMEGAQAVGTMLLTVNAPPTISPIPDQEWSPFEAALAIPFTIADDLSPVETLQVEVSYQGKSPPVQLELEGGGANWTVKVMPALWNGGIFVILTVRESGPEPMYLTSTIGFGVRAMDPPAIIIDQVYALAALPGDADTSRAICIAEFTVSGSDVSLSLSNESLYELGPPSDGGFSPYWFGVYLKAGTGLDYQSQSSISGSVVVNDRFGQQASGGWNIRVTDPNVPLLDVDSDNRVDGLADGLLLLRYLFDFRGLPLVNGLVGRTCGRSAPAAVAHYLDACRSSMLDVDRDGSVFPLTDGLLLLRYLNDIRGAALINGVLGPAAERTDPEDIAAFLDAYLPGPGAKGSGKVPASTERLTEEAVCTFEESRQTHGRSTPWRYKGTRLFARVV